MRYFQVTGRRKLVSFGNRKKHGSLTAKVIGELRTMKCDRRGQAAVSFSTGKTHRYYEDRYRLLTKDIPVVREQGRGEVYAVFDGIGGAPKGRDAAQAMSDCLIQFYLDADRYPATSEGFLALLMHANTSVYSWGMLPSTDRPLGGCAGTVAWLWGDTLTVFHAGDTMAILIRNSEPTQLTQIHEMGKVMFRYFGFGPLLQIDLTHHQVEESDRILLVSDGVTKVYHPAEAALVVEEYNDISKGAAELARRSKARDSHDDITVMLIELEEI